jgi:DNA-binding response OmpR family regulator
MFKVLIVDDTKSVHTFVKELLRKKTGIVFSDAFNGVEAIELVKKSNEKFDLILLDWEMPIKTGPETLKELKALGYPAPVVMMTTRNAPDEILKLLEMGAAEYIIKPFTADILIEKIEYACGEAFSRAA